MFEVCAIFPLKGRLGERVHMWLHMHLSWMAI